MKLKLHVGDPGHLQGWLEANRMGTCGRQGSLCCLPAPSPWSGNWPQALHVSSNVWAKLRYRYCYSPVTEWCTRPKPPNGQGSPRPREVPCIRPPGA